MNQRHKRAVNRDNQMIEEHKGVVANEDDSDLDTVGASSKLIKIRGGAASSRNEAEFEEGDCESDYEDQLDTLRQAKRRRREDTALKENRRMIKSTYLPASSKKLAACVTCRLVLNREKWRKLGQCPNCP